MDKLPPEVRKFLSEIGRKGGKIGGKSKSPAKLAAVRRNAKQGGRPPKKRG